MAINCTLKALPFGFCFLQVMPLFRILFSLLRRSEEKSHIRETKHILTYADSSTDTTVGWTKNTQKPDFF